MNFWSHFRLTLFCWRREANVALLGQRAGPGLPQEERRDGAASTPWLRLLLRSSGSHGPLQGLPLLRAQPQNLAPGALLPSQVDGLDGCATGDQRGSGPSRRTPLSVQRTALLEVWPGQSASHQGGKVGHGSELDWLQPRSSEQQHSLTSRESCRP